MGKHIGTSGLARGKILGRLAFYTWGADTSQQSSTKVIRAQTKGAEVLTS